MKYLFISFVENLLISSIYSYKEIKKVKFWEKKNLHIMKKWLKRKKKKIKIIKVKMQKTTGKMRKQKMIKTI